MTSRSRLVLASTLALSLLAVGACSAEGGGGEGSDGPLVIGVRPRNQDQMTQLVAAYQNEYPDVEIEIQALPDSQGEYVQRLATAQLSGETPDIMDNLIDLVDQIASNDVTTDLTPFFGGAAGLSEDQFIPAFLDQYRPAEAPEELHAIPLSTDATVLYYNEALLGEHGVALPTPEWTWDDLYEASAELSEACAGECWGLSANDSLNPATYQPVISAFGGFVFDVESNTVGIGEPEAIEAWEYMLEPFDSGASVPWDLSAFSGNPSPVDFRTGSVGFVVQTRSQVQRLREAMPDGGWDVMDLPTINGVRPIGGGSRGLSISESSTMKDEAWQFLSWIVDPEGGLDILEESYGVVSPTIDGLESGLWRELPGPPSNVEVYAAAARDPLLLVQILPGRAQAILTDEVMNAVQRVLVEGAPAAEAFAQAQEVVNEALAQE